MENVSSRDPAQPSSSSRIVNQRSEELSVREPSLWQQNHGNLLIGFAGLICLVGFTVLSCQQIRFRPPAFPSNLTPPGETAALASNDRTAGRDVRVFDLQIIGAASDQGVMRIAVYISPEGFNDPRRAFEVDSWQIVDGVAAGKWEVTSEVQRLAIAAYHDENNNGELDRNALGIPAERYGFSADARGLTGPPPFDDAVISLSDKPVTISIR